MRRDEEGGGGRRRDEGQAMHRQKGFGEGLGFNFGRVTGQGWSAGHDWSARSQIKREQLTGSPGKCVSIGYGVVRRIRRSSPWKAQPKRGEGDMGGAALPGAAAAGKNERALVCMYARRSVCVVCVLVSARGRVGAWARA
eukprot:3652109-Pleurochrysis_carterae.AAC.1